jgi:hypothetical protein
MNKIKMNNKGQNQYMSWILIFGMVIALSFLLYNWSIEQAKERTQEIESRTDPLVCQELSINIDSACQKSNTIVFNITNVNTVKVYGFVFRTVGLYPSSDDYLNSKTIYSSIEAADTKKFELIKENTLSQIQIIPIGRRKTMDIICDEKSITKEIGDLKQC